MSKRIFQRLAVAYPAGNTTAVVFDELGKFNRKKLNADIMSAWQAVSPDQPPIEQCCFVTRPKNKDALARIEMFGGEFCGNAARSAIWLITESEDTAGSIEVSGVQRPLRFAVKDRVVSVEIPLVTAKNRLRSVAEGTLVRLDGITQLVVIDPTIRQTPRQLLTNILEQNRFGLISQPCVGVSCYSTATNQAQFCVWVKEVNTIFDETACGSGTAAIGIVLATQSDTSLSLDVVQPSGKTIKTSCAIRQNTVTKSFISGTVDVLYDGEFALP